MIKWRRQYAEDGLAGLEDAPRPGGPKTVLTEEAICEILAATVTPPPESLRAQGRDALVEPAAGGLAAPDQEDPGQPRLDHPAVAASTACSRTAPRGSSSPPTRSWTPRSATSWACTCTRPRTPSWSAWTRSRQCQALERASRSCRCAQGIPERQTHDYVRHGMTSLFAALNTATGQVTDACYPRHRHQEFLNFLKKTAAAYPGTELHVICDNYATHKHAEVRGMARPPGEPADHPALHANRMLMDQPRGVLLLRDHPPGHPPRLLHLRQRTRRRHRRVHRLLERPPQARSPGPRTPTRSSPASTARRLKQTHLHTTRSTNVGGDN